jgi:probable F420-dependent oxidoreductase
VKIRIGVGTGRLDPDQDLGALVDDLDELHFDSIWLSEVLTSPGFDPLVGLAYAAARNSHLKLGTTMLLPGRNIVRLAKALSSLDQLSRGRLLVTLVPGLNDEPERSAIGPEPKRRGAAIDEGLPLLRQLLSGEPTAYDGPLGHFEPVTISPTPVQTPLEFWLGGSAPAALDRCGRLADGWLPSMSTPEEALEGRRRIEAAASEAGRTIDPEHFGLSVAYASTEPAPAALERLRARARGRALSDLVPIGLPALRKLLESYIDVGFSKFVVRPLALEWGWRAELEALANEVGGLQT